MKNIRSDPQTSRQRPIFALQIFAKPLTSELSAKDADRRQRKMRRSQEKFLKQCKKGCSFALNLKMFEPEKVGHLTARPEAYEKDDRVHQGTWKTAKCDREDRSGARNETKTRWCLVVTVGA